MKKKETEAKTRKSQAAQKKVYYQKNKEKIRLQEKALYQKNREKIRLQRKAEYQKNRKKINLQVKAYRLKNKEKISLRDKAYRLKNKEKINLRDKVYYWKCKASRVMVKKAPVKLLKAQRSISQSCFNDNVPMTSVAKALNKKKPRRNPGRPRVAPVASEGHTPSTSGRLQTSTVDGLVNEILSDTVGELRTKLPSLGEFAQELDSQTVRQLITGGQYAVYIGYTSRSIRAEGFGFVNRAGKKGRVGEVYGHSVLEYVERPKNRKHSRPYVLEATKVLNFVSFTVGTYDDNNVALLVEAALQGVTMHSRSKSRFLGIRLFRGIARTPRLSPTAVFEDDFNPSVYVTVAKIDVQKSSLKNGLISLNGHMLRVVS